MRVCKFHAKEFIDSITIMTNHFTFIKNIGEDCECLMGYPESKCGNKSVVEYMEIQ